MNDPINDGKQAGGRNSKGRFAPGNKISLGRPLGRSKVSELREKLAQDLDQVNDLVRAQALAGDPQAIRVLLDRVLPALRPIELPAQLDMPEGTLTEQGRAVMAATASGDLAPGQASQLLTAIGTLAKIAETDELTHRITALEEKLNAKS